MKLRHLKRNFGKSSRIHLSNCYEIYVKFLYGNYTTLKGQYMRYSGRTFEKLILDLEENNYNATSDTNKTFNCPIISL